MENSPDVTAALSDRYVIERELGSGGMAVVYLARDRKLDREVALKVLRPELGAVLGSERFLAEIKIAAKLDHPHILTLIDSGEADGMLYYVLPYVRGESLRDKLNREHQLGLDEALTITKQVASALDYAHRQGLVHRDIKPENILIQEDEAMLADFGIALAVKEAGGNRLTQTGLSLGTPQYMSPEQATGDRGIDARSDVYSLAAVLYEMLAGEPPVTGANAQSMIAKLMTERPTHLRILRDTVPEEIDAAVAKALAKTPADRFTTAGDFARALFAKPAHEARSADVPPRPNRRPMIAGIAVLIVLAALGAFVMRGKSSAAQPSGVGAVLGQKTQLTTSGAVLIPAISPDGKQLAYATRHCNGGACTFSIVVQDVGGTTTRSILDGATAAYGLEWSPDRRNLDFNGTFGGQAGTFLLSALGGTPRFLTGGTATFYAGGDSLLMSAPAAADSVYWIRVAGLDAVVHDSIRVAGRGQGIWALSSVPGTNWIVVLILQQPHGLWQVIDRSGKVADHVVNACTCGGSATSDAVWLARAGKGDDESIVRIGLDRATGKLATRQDTMVTGLFTNFSLTSDGTGMVMDQGTYDFSVWALDMPDLLNGHYPDNRRIAQSSGGVSATVSPDGSRLLVRRVVPTGHGLAELHYSVMPFTGGTETPLGGMGTDPAAARWVDSVTVEFRALGSKGLHFAEMDVRTDAQRNTLDIPDSTVQDAAPIPDGWAWIPAAGDRIIIRQGEHTRELHLPAWYAAVYQLYSEPSGQRIFFTGFNKPSADTIGVSAVSLSDASTVQWASMFADRGYLTPLADGSEFFSVAQTQETLSFFKLTGPGKIERIGTSPRPVRLVSVSQDLKRAVASDRDYRADAWMNRVIKP